MGDLRDWSREANFSDLEEQPSSSSSSSSSLCPEAIGEESWRRAEDLTQGIIGKIKPNSVSEQRRRAVIDYVQRLLRGCLQCEVFPFGSVPLKTYLPDGDIDLTAFGGIIAEEAFANDVFSVLEREDKNGAAEFVVKDVQYIRAEVKLVKCIVQNIVVDISFNQLGGLSTLCFLEKVDRLIGKDNLFKRSIILIKAWCYYESRILGAHHGLISTYALETMVLYIFHIFHSSLDGPLAVLYKFLDYYSKFDWEKYCVSLRGPVHVSSLPEFIVETTDKYAGEPLLSNEFLKECAEMFSVPSKAFGANARTFLPKHLNIVDPLKESNNLGRSVSKGNLVRIRSAFTLGARKLEKILSQPEEILSDELRTFFMSTLDRHGSGERPDIQDDGLKYGYNGLGVNASFPYLELSQEDQYNSSKSLDGSGFDGLLNYRTSVHGLFNNVKIPETPTNRKSEVRAQQSLREVMLSIKSLEADDFSKGDSVCKARLFGDARDLASARIENLEMSNDTSKSSPPTEGDCPLASRMNLLAHVDFSSSPDVEPIDGTSEKEQSENSGNVDVSSGTSQISAMGSRHSQHSIPSKNQLANSQKVPSSIESRHQTSQLSQLSMSPEDFVPRHPGLWPSSCTAGTPEPPKSLPDLDGDYECQLNSLQFGKRWFDFAMGAPIPPVSPPLISQYQSKNLWDGMEVVRQSVQPKLEQYSQMPTNALAPRPVFYPRSSPIIPGASFGIEDMPKPRGTGTYFPNMSHYKDRSSTGRGRNQAPVRSPRYNGRNMTFPETGFNDRSDMEPLQTRGKSGSSSDNYYPSGAKVHMGANGTIHPSEKTLQFGSVTEAASSPECSKQPVPVTKPLSNSSKVGVQKLKPASTGTNQDRLPVQSYHLKDEEDFPPLSV